MQRSSNEIAMETVSLFQLCVILIGIGTVRLAFILPSPDVAAPDNLSIVCRNGTNRAYWNYSGPTADSFLVTITSYNNHGAEIFHNKTREHHIDISSVTPHHEQDVYGFTLVANNGSVNSSEVQTSFSYSSNFPVPVPCFMDFPSPTIKAEANKIMFEFANPDYIDYEENGTDDDSVTIGYFEPKKFEYTVYTSHDEKESTFECSEADEFCQGEMLLNIESIKNCTTLELRGEIYSIRYKTSEDFCNVVPENGHWPVLLPVVSCVIVLAGLVVILIGMRKLAKAVIKSHRLPDILHPRPGSASQRILQPEAADTSKAQAGNTPLLHTPEDSPTDTLIPVFHQGCQEQTHFIIPAPLPPSDNSSNQPGDGYAARLEGELDSKPQPESRDDDRHDDYMKREQISDNPDEMAAASL